jgi:alpha-tubulin suppressor-like RCC1 family protein
MGIRSGELWAWGSGGNGRTGFGDTTQRNIPTRVGSASDWSHGELGSQHSMMIKTTGTLWVCGLQTNGRLGNGQTGTGNVTTMTQIGVDTDWHFVSSNKIGSAFLTEYSFAIKGGRLYGTGLNSSGQLGIEPSADVSTFTDIGNGSNYVNLTSGQGFNLAIRNTP